MPEACTIDTAAEAASSGHLRCREIRGEDRGAVAALLAKGFGCAPAFWLNALGQLARHDPPANLPRYGYLLECGGTPVGALLLIFSEIEENGKSALRCNVSSWYVEPRFRAFASLLVARALRHREATYINLTPAPQTLPILKAQGYREFCTGRFYAFPAIGRPRRRARVIDTEEAMPELGEFERRVLRQHAKFGCLSLVCESGGDTYPFVFAVRRRAGVPVAALLVYCRALEEFRLCAGDLGRHLARRGIFCVMLHANGPLADVPGFFRRTTPIYYIGDAPPRPGNLAWSECAMFGVRP
ncbi:MAG TPA: hypothetical protein VGL35_04275 [Rhizomicrobium sp.]